MSEMLSTSHAPTRPRFNSPAHRSTAAQASSITRVMVMMPWISQGKTKVEDISGGD